MPLPGKAKKVLVIDDSEICCEFTRMTLEAFGYSVVTMTSHFGFVKTLRQELPDIVLVDVTMPSFSGPKLVELAHKKLVHKCTIVLYSDRSEQELAALAASCGANGYIRKTSSEIDLVRSVSRFISGTALKA